jgi:hypothetical protein
LWRADGKELVFVVPGGGLWSIEVKTGANFESGPPKPLFNPAEARIESTTGGNYTMSNDGKRFLVRVASASTTNEVEPVHVVLNWPSLLK